MRETAQVARAQAACEASHVPATEHDIYSRPIKEEL